MAGEEFLELPHGDTHASDSIFVERSERGGSESQPDRALRLSLHKLGRALEAARSPVYMCMLPSFRRQPIWAQLLFLGRHSTWAWPYLMADNVKADVLLGPLEDDMLGPSGQVTTLQRLTKPLLSYVGRINY